jgi:glycosyltransferase involved in cell wall biosynthesis
MDYVLITPAKDEEENLPRLADCVASQTILPKIWLIVDDCSSDNTPLVIERLEEEFSWIKGLRLHIPHERDLDEYFGRIYDLAFRYAIRHCKEKSFPFDFLVKVDADVIFPDDCIERILAKFIEDERLGIASPQVEDVALPVSTPFEPQKLYKYTTLKNAHRHKQYDFLPEPSDGLRVYRTRTFEDIGGIPETMDPDVVALAKAKQEGWKVMRFKDIMAIKTRTTNTSVPDGCELRALRYYRLDYHPLIMILNVALEAGTGHIGKAVRILTEYMKEVIENKEKIKDENVRNYFRNTRLKEILYSMWKKGP